MTAVVKSKKCAGACAIKNQLHLNFMKTVLGVKPSTNTCLIYTKSGRFP